MVAKLADGGLALNDEYAMKRAPRGFEAIDDPEIAAAVRNASFICSRDIADARLASPNWSTTSSPSPTTPCRC